MGLQAGLMLERVQASVVKEADNKYQGRRKDGNAGFEFSEVHASGAAEGKSLSDS